ncbi:hypothetical protein BDV18DRAFT_23764 [Aspergillus unguis]
MDGPQSAVTAEQLPGSTPLDENPRSADAVTAETTDQESPQTSTTLATLVLDLPPAEPSPHNVTMEVLRELEAPAPPTDSDSPTAEEDAEEDAYWADEEEDTSVPDEAELKEMESQKIYSALDHEYWEKNFHPNLDDPEYRPTEKARLTWKIKGVRGTKENPNRLKIMRSPPAYIGGYWWTIKFFPRGNNVGAMSVYIECSSTMPTPDETQLETEFRVLRSPAETELNDNTTPDLEMKFGKTEDPTAWTETFKAQYSAAANQSEPTKETWRVSAQIGVVCYNPAEPRTGYMQSSCHQFNPHNLDWGWTNFHGPWNEIHRRQRGKHQALLRNDTLAFDAYIRIFDDPTRSLWWHTSDAEPTWDSLGLTGYRPLGDSVINHSADVAGLATLLHVAPFCKIIQSVDVTEHLTNCDVKPKPLCDTLQKLLWQLRQRDQSLQYVDTDLVTTTLRNLRESSSDVCEFWERLRRSLDLELAGTPAAKELAELFDSPLVESLPADIQQAGVNAVPKDYNSRIHVPADKAKTTSEAFSWYFGNKSGRWVLPPVLHLELGRQKLDKAARQWRLLYNRVDLDEELDLSPFVLDGECGNYILYGYIVHRGRRTSGKFFSILRPGGPGTKWLAFDDGSDNRVECLTKKTALGPHLGLELGETPDHKSGHDVAIAVMYIRSDVIKEFLPGPQGPWEASDELKQYYDTGRVDMSMSKQADGAAEKDIQIEVYTLDKYDTLGNLFDAYDLMSQAKAANSVMYMSVPRSTNLTDIRKKIGHWASAQTESEISPDNIRLWQFDHAGPTSSLPPFGLSRVTDLRATPSSFVNPVRYWLQIVSDEDAKYFSMKDPEIPVAVSSKPEEAVVERRGSETSDDAPAAPITDGAEPSSSGTANQTPVEGESGSEPTVTTEPAVGTMETSASVVPEMPQTGTSSEPTSIVQSAEGLAVTAVVEAPSNPEVNTDNALDVPQLSQPPLSSSFEASEDTGNNEVASGENDAAIAALVEGDVQQHEEEVRQTTRSGDSPAQESDTSITLNQVEGSGEAEAETSNNSEEAEAEAILPVEHVYYFLQVFDVESQSLSTIGSFFSQAGEKIKPAIRKHLGWPATKDFQIWHRFELTELTNVSSMSCFGSASPDGSCYIVGDKLDSEKRSQYNEKSLFVNPGLLVNYLWAASRHHPTKAFTGTKTVDATFTSDFYSGEIMKGHFHGKGKHISDSASTYTGDFVLGKRHGKGLMEYPTGDTYDGDWSENQYHGQGTFVERKTGNKYVGGYKDGKRHGKGISYWEVADEEKDLCQICFGEEQDALFYDCGHVCACVTCARMVDICPICRKKIINVVKIYRT